MYYLGKYEKKVNILFHFCFSTIFFEILNICVCLHEVVWIVEYSLLNSPKLPIYFQNYPSHPSFPNVVFKFVFDFL